MKTNKAVVLFVCLAYLPAFAPAAHGQRHPPEIRGVYPLGGSQAATTRVTIAGVSFRGASQLLFDRPGIAATVLPQDTSKMPPANGDSDGDPSVTADIAVARATAPGLCRFRVVSPSGVSNAGVWMIGRGLPQIEEKEPNGDMTQAQAVTLPAAVNGHIGDTGDQDTYSVTLAANVPFVAEVIANRVGSPLDSLLTLRDASGQEVASNDDYRSPDSLLIYTPRTAGRYYLTLAASDGQAGAAFAYRLEMGALPLLTSVFPASAQLGKSEDLSAEGFNLTNAPAAPNAANTNASPASSSPALRVPLGAASMSGIGRVFVATDKGVSSNSLPVLLSPLPVITPSEPGHDLRRATLLPTPGIANGRFRRKPQAAPTSKSGSSANANASAPADYYRFRADAGQRYIIDAQCQALGSPADPILTLYGPDGKQMAENDDFNGRDAHLDMALNQAGDYTLRVAETRGHSGPDYVYCLVVQTPPPGFALAAETRARSVGQGGIAPIEVTVTRDRWDGPVVLGVRDLPPGVTATPCLVPPGVTRGLLLLIADKTAPLAAFPLHILGTAQIQGTTVQRTLENATDWVWNGGARASVPAPANLLTFAVSNPVEITLQPDTPTVPLLRGQGATVKVKLTRLNGYAKPVTLRVLGLPDGITAADVAVPADKSEASVELKAAPTAPLGTVTIALTAVVSATPLVQIDRASPALTLTIAAPKK